MRKVLSGVVAVLLTGTSGYAADLYQPQVIEAPVQEAAIVETGGWYLRGDAGWSYNKMRGAHYFQGSNDLDTDFDTASLKNGFTIGGGVGYQINDHFRTDVTLDYMFKSDFHGSTSGGGAGGGACAVACTSTDVASLTALSLLANAYVDIGTYGSFTPYVGAGIGGTYVKWNDLENTSCADDGSGCDDTYFHRGRKSWRFTYALMAGLAYDISPNLKLDLGYKYTHVAGGDMFDWDSASAAAGATGVQGKDDGFSSQEVRIGLRYELW